MTSPEDTTAAPPPATTANDPPMYRQLQDGGLDPDEELAVAVFVLHGRFIYAEGPAGVADSEPLYQLSRAIQAQGRATQTIDFQRLDYRVRTAADGSPAVSRRARDVYLMRYVPTLWRVGLDFQATLAPQSRKTVGEVRIVRGPLFRSGYRAVKVVAGAAQDGRKVDKGAYHFLIKHAKGDDWNWSDPDGRLVASQVCEGFTRSDSGEAEHKLRVMVSLPRRTLDSLVAIWCLWQWHLHIVKDTVGKTWEDRKSTPWLTSSEEVS